MGNTPILRLLRLEKTLSLHAEIYAKLEYFNPFGSVKDRTAKSMLDHAEKTGVLKKGGTIIEPTSGNTGISLAALGVARGYQVMIVMPENFSLERQKLILSYGAQLVLTDPKGGMQGAIERAKELAKEQKNAVILDQFTNPANPKAHEQTGAEIYADLGDKIDIFVCGVGTGGTLSGVSAYLKRRIARLKTVAVEPQKSAVLSSRPKGEHGLQGIGAGFIPKTLDFSQIDEVACVRDEDAYAMQKLLVETDGVFCGISSGAAIVASVEQAKRAENAGKKIVVIFPDGGDRYLSNA